MIVEQAGDQEQQRLEQADGVIEFDAVFIGGFGLEDFERTVDCAASQLLQVDAGGSEAFGDAGFGQLRELLRGCRCPSFRAPAPFLR